MWPAIRQSKLSCIDIIEMAPNSAAWGGAGLVNERKRHASKRMAWHDLSRHETQSA